MKECSGCHHSLFLFCNLWSTWNCASKEMYIRAANHVGYTVDLYTLALLRRHSLSSYLLMKIPISPTHIIYGTKLASFFFIYFPAKYWKNFSFSLTGFTFSAYHVLFMTLILVCEKVRILKLLSLVVQFYTLSLSFLCPSLCHI